MTIEAPEIDWKSLRIGMLGGDRREQEIARRAAATGADVRAHGFPWPEGGIPGVVYLSDPAAVLDNAKFALFPGYRRRGHCLRRQLKSPLSPIERC
jgi:hypothetical protein